MATDLAALGLRVESGEVREATRDLDRFSTSADGAERQANRLTGVARLLGQALGGISVALVTRQALQMADAWKTMQGQLSLVTKSTAELTTATNALFEISQRTRVSFDATVSLYTRLARSTDTLGASQAQVRQVTETINKALIVSGTSAETASGALMQLGQAFASGALRGDELNSVMEGMPRLAQAIADGMGITIGQLRALGAEGKLTGDAVFTALLSQQAVIEKEFARMPVTIGQAMGIIENEMLRAAGQFDALTGASTKLATAISGAAQYLDEFAAALIGIAASAAILSIPVLLGAIGTALMAIPAIMASAWGAIVANPILLVAAAVGGLAASMASAEMASRKLEAASKDVRATIDEYGRAAALAAGQTGTLGSTSLAAAMDVKSFGGEAGVAAGQLYDMAAAAKLAAVNSLMAKQAMLQGEIADNERLTRQGRRQLDASSPGALVSGGVGLIAGDIKSVWTNGQSDRDIEQNIASAKKDLADLQKLTQTVMGQSTESFVRHAKAIAGDGTEKAAKGKADAIKKVSDAVKEAAEAMKKAEQDALDYAVALEKQVFAFGKSDNEVLAWASAMAAAAAPTKEAADRINEVTDQLIGLKKGEAAVRDLNTAMGQFIAMPSPDFDTEAETMARAFEEAARQAADIRYAVDDIFYGIREKNWAGAFAGLFNVIVQLQKAFDTTADKSQRMGAVGGVLTGVGGAIGGKVGAGIGAVGSGFSAASAVTTAATTMKAMGGAAAGFSGAIAGLAGPIGIAVAGFSLLSGILGDQKAKKRAKLEKEAQDIQNARALAQERANQRAELELKILELSGDEVGALTRKREAELAALDGANRALAQHVHALEDWAKMVGTAKDAVTKAEQDLRDAYEADRDRLTGIIGGVEKARERLRDAYGRERSAIEGTISSVRSLLDTFTDFRNELDLMAVANDPGRQYGYAQRQFAGATNDNFVDRGRAFAEASQSASASDLDFQRDLAAVRRRTDDAAKTAQNQLSTAERQLLALDAMVEPLLGANDNLISVDAAIRALTTAEQDAALAVEELARLDAQVGALIAINSSVLSVVQAVNNLQGALGALAAAQAAKPAEGAGGPGSQAVGLTGYVDKNADLAALYASGGGMAAGRTKEQFAAYHWERYGQAEGRTYTAFAAGGDHTGGWRLVGEEGPELEATGPSRIFSADQTSKMLGGDTSRLEALVEELTEEVAQLRKEQAQNNFEIKRNTKDSAEAMAKVTRGSDAVRTVAA